MPIEATRVENGDIVTSLPMPSTPGRHGIYPIEDPIPHLPPVDSVLIQIDPEPGRLHHRGCQIGRMDNILLGMQPTLRHVPPNVPHFDESHVQMVKPVIDDGVFRSRCR